MRLGSPRMSVTLFIWPRKSEGQTQFPGKGSGSTSQCREQRAHPGGAEGMDIFGDWLF